MSSNRPVAELIIGDRLTLGGTYGESGRILLKETNLGARDAEFEVQGDTRIAGIARIEEGLLGGLESVPGYFQWIGETDFNIGPVNFRNGPLSTSPITAKIEPTTGLGSFVDIHVNGISLQTFVTNVIVQEQGGLFPNILLDQLNHAVPGQANTFYIDKGATSHGYNVRADEVSDEPRLQLYRSGATMLLGVDYIVVRSQSTGPEGFAAVGSLNAIQILEPIILSSPRIWYSYVRKDQASG
jgi:hypothetical protein